MDCCLKKISLVAIISLISSISFAQTPPSSYSVIAEPYPQIVNAWQAAPITSGPYFYNYWVTPIYPQGEEGLSNAVSIHYTSVPLTVCWTPVPGAIGYNVYRKNANAPDSNSLVSPSPFPPTQSCFKDSNNSTISHTPPSANLPYTYTFASGSSNVPFASTVASISDAGGQVFNVKAYGAKGDGITDDTAAINSAFLSAENAHGTLFFPTGTYAHASALNWTGVNNLRIEGAGRGCSSVAGNGGCSTVLLYTGPALTGTCPVEMVNDYWVSTQHIGFESSNAVACQILLGSPTTGESFHLVFTNIDTQSATIASIANFGAESIVFDGDFTISSENGSRGLLISSNGGAGFGISSQFGYTFASRSTTMFSFIGGTFAQQGGTGNINIELDGTGTGITDLQFLGDFQQVDAGSSVLKIDGVVQGLGVHGARMECDVASGAISYFLNFNSARLDASTVTEFNPSSAGVGLAFSTGSAEIDGLVATGTNLTTFTDTGNVNNLWLDSYVVPTVSITGNLNGVVKSETGTPSVSATGSMNITLNTLTNVVWDKNLSGVGSSTFTLPNTVMGFFKASFIGSECSFLDDGVFGTWVTAGTVSISQGSGTIACPAIGTVTSAPTITATYTNTGGQFIVQEF